MEGALTMGDDAPNDQDIPRFERDKSLRDSPCNGTTLLMYVDAPAILADFCTMCH